MPVHVEQPGKSGVLTDTPEKNYIENLRSKKKRVKPIQLFKSEKGKTQESGMKRKQLQNSTTEDDGLWEQREEDESNLEELINEVLMKAKF
jgi:hypothetical protein